MRRSVGLGMAASIAQHGPFLAPTGTQLAQHSTFHSHRYKTSPVRHPTTTPPVSTTAKTNQYPTLKAPLLHSPSTLKVYRANEGNTVCTIVALSTAPYV